MTDLKHKYNDSTWQTEQTDPTWETVPRHTLHDRQNRKILHHRHNKTILHGRQNNSCMTDGKTHPAWEIMKRQIPMPEWIWWSWWAAPWPWSSWACCWWRWAGSSRDYPAKVADLRWHFHVATRFRGPYPHACFYAPERHPVCVPARLLVLGPSRQPFRTIMSAYMYCHVFLDYRTCRAELQYFYQSRRYR